MDSSRWTPLNLAWLAGLFEGEGSITLRRQERKGCVVTSFQFHLAMTDRDVIERARDIIGRGDLRIGERYASHPKWKTQYVLQLSRGREIVTLLWGMYPWLGRRRREHADEIVRAWQERPLADRRPGYCRKNLHPIPPGADLCRECRREWERLRPPRRRSRAKTPN